MGEPVRIVDLARDLARLAGRDPDSVPIRYIGLRPGEKLHEALFYQSERVSPTGHPKVLRVTHQERDDADLMGTLDALVRIGASGEHERAREALRTALARLDSASGVATAALSAAAPV
jgi:FlaA1/EpsC-like NDP-sugar epimerase